MAKGANGGEMPEVNGSALVESGVGKPGARDGLRRRQVQGQRGATRMNGSMGVASALTGSVRRRGGGAEVPQISGRGQLSAE